jgi:hypothetical protein
MHWTVLAADFRSDLAVSGEFVIIT